MSALASLLLSQNPNRTNKEIDKIIKVTAHDQVGDRDEDSPGWDKYYGYGRVDAYLALTYDITPEIQEKIREIEDNTKKFETKNKKKDDAEASDGDSRKKDKKSDARTKSKPAKPD